MQQNDNLSYLVNTEPVQIAAGTPPVFDTNFLKSLDDEDAEEPDLFSLVVQNTPKSPDFNEELQKFVDRDTLPQGRTRGVEDLSELTEFDFITPSNVYESGAVNRRYEEQTVPELIGKGIYNMFPAFVQGALMPVSAVYSTFDYYVGNDNPYDNMFTGAKDWLQDNKYKVYGKDGQVDITDFTSGIEQIGMQLGIMAGTLPFAALSAPLSAGSLAALGVLSNAAFMAYTEGMEGARDTYNDKYKQVLKETNNDEYAKKIADTAAKVEVNTNVLLNTALNIIPTKWLLKNNKFNILGEMEDEATRLQYRFRPQQLAEETLEEFEKRLIDLKNINSTNLNRDLFDFTNKFDDLKYNLKNKKEYLVRNADVIGEVFGEGLEEYHNAYAHELAMKINNEKDIDSLGLGSIPYGTIGKDIVTGQFFKDMANNNHFYDFASGAIVSGITSPFFRKMRLNRTKEFNAETGQYEYKYDRSKYNPFKNSSYFEYRDDDLDVIDINNKATASLQILNQMKQLNNDYVSATDEKTRNSVLNQMINVPLVKYLNNNTIDLYLKSLDVTKQDMQKYNDAINKENVLAAYDKYTAATTEEDKKDFNHILAQLPEKQRAAFKTDIATKDITPYLTDIKSNMSKNQAEIDKHISYVKGVKENYNNIVKAFESKGITPQNDYGFLADYTQNKLALNEETKLNNKLSSEISNKVNQIKTTLKDDKEYVQKQTELKNLEGKIEKLQDGAEKENMIKNLVNLSKDLAVIEMTAINADISIQTVLAEKQKSDNRLAQYESYDSYLTTNSKGERIDTELQKLNRKIQSFQHQDTDIRLYNEYKSKINNMTAPFVNTPYYDKVKTIVSDQVKNEYKPEELEKIQKIQDFIDNRNKYTELLEKHKDKDEGHFLSKYFKNNKRLIDELEKYEQAKNDVIEFHRALFSNNNPYSNFMSLYVVTDKYFNKDNNYSISAIQEKINNYNTNYQKAMEYLAELKKKYEDLQATDNVNRSMFIKHIEKLEYLVAKTGKDVERLSVQFNKDLFQERYNDISSIFKKLRNIPNLTEDIIKNNLILLNIEESYLNDIVKTLLSTNKNAGIVIPEYLPLNVFNKFGNRFITKGKQLVWNGETYTYVNTYQDSDGKTVQPLLIDGESNTNFHITEAMIENYNLEIEVPLAFTTNPPDDYRFATKTGESISYETLRKSKVSFREMQDYAVYISKVNGLYYVSVKDKIYVSDENNVLSEVRDRNSNVYVDYLFSINTDKQSFMLEGNLYENINGQLTGISPKTEYYVEENKYSFTEVTENNTLLYENKNEETLEVPPSKENDLSVTPEQAINVLDYMQLLEDIEVNYEIHKVNVNKIKNSDLTEILNKINTKC